MDAKRRQKQLDDNKRQELERLGTFSCPDSDARERRPTGVLLSDEIEHYVHFFKLIHPFDHKKLKAAGYELTIGDEYILDGEKRGLVEDGEIRIPPFNVVVIKTKETINLPRFLIARWNIRVKWAYRGLLWVGGPQVDPGWVGHLFCPIYNLSDKEVVLRSTDTIALMDFVTTTPFTPGKSKSYNRPPKRVLMDEYGADMLRSALYTEAKERMDRVEERTDTLTGSTILAFTILFAALAVLATRTGPVGSLWDFMSLAAAIAALGFAFSAYRKTRQRTSMPIRLLAWFGASVAIALLVLAAYQGYRRGAAILLDTRQAIVDGKTSQDSLRGRISEVGRQLDSIINASP